MRDPETHHYGIASLFLAVAAWLVLLAFVGIAVRLDWF